MTSKTDAQSQEASPSVLDHMRLVSQIFADYRDGTLSADQANAMFKALSVPAKPAVARGRPVGARTKQDTQALRRAREFVRLQDEDGMKRTRAARCVAAAKNVSVETIYNDARRHRSRLRMEAQKDKLKQYDFLYFEGQQFMKTYPSAADPILSAWVDACEKIALEIEALGNPKAARAVRECLPLFEQAAAISVAMLYEAILKMAPDIGPKH
jgi:hypothetical protein